MIIGLFDLGQDKSKKLDAFATALIRLVDFTRTMASNSSQLAFLENVLAEKFRPRLKML